MAREVSSISRVGTTEPFELQASRGHVGYHAPLFKYGYNPEIINVNETIWDVGGIYAYPASAVAMTATSTSAGTDAGIRVLIQGLDADYRELQEEVTLNGSGTATTTGLFLRIFSATVVGASSPTGTINIANGGTTYARITAGENQSLMAIYTVPAGKTLYVTQGIATHGTDNSGAFITIRFMVRLPGSVFITQTKVDVINSEIVFPFSFPLRIPEKSDLEVRAVCSKNQTNAISAIFEGVLINNGEDF